eukprot:GEMP01052248.1.p1 GENE.GEMP01052248.1~~GEMP01052248.1.p1  ORF type:complete len:176 (+),score=42.26 GEMP01052248.1:125-652(+)
MAESSQVAIYLNVYDLNDGCIRAYHSGLQGGSREYSFFDGGGIAHHAPKRAHVGEFKESIYMGTIDNWHVLDNAVGFLRAEFGRRDYDLLYHNCNHFTDALCKRLFNKGIPGKVNRLATVGSMPCFRCCLPACIGIRPKKPTKKNVPQVMGDGPPNTSRAAINSSARRSKGAQAA